jgi:glutamine synthetase
MPPRKSSHSSSFVARHNLWTNEQARAASAMEKAITKNKLELVRFAFCDQHGTLRGKTLVASEVASALRSGVTMTTTLLAKDTSHRSMFPVFASGGGMNIPEMQGAGNFIMVPDPTTFCVLPWAPNTGWLLCDIHFPNGKPVPHSTRQLYRDALGKLSDAGYDFFAGLEVEFHLLRIEDHNLAPESIVWPPEPPSVSHTTHGFQYLTEARFDQVAPIMDELRKVVQTLGMPLRSLEVELGPSQYEFTFAPEAGMLPADRMVLFRSALRQAARRHGYLVSFMCRPRLPNTLASGWHLHYSLLDKKRTNAFVSKSDELLSPLGRAFLAGVLAHARAQAAFTTPTLNGYKRYHGINSMAPIQAIWARDNRGVMMRVMGDPGDPSTHLENRVGEPLANPYLYMASQIHAGLDGVKRRLEPGLSADSPYEVTAEPLPKSLGEALDALNESQCFRAGFGDAFVDYFITIKRGEIARANADESHRKAPNEVTQWEHREYFDLA